MLKGTLNEINSRIGNYEDEQARADAVLMSKMIEKLLEDATVVYHQKHRRLMSGGVELEKSEQAGKTLWRAEIETASKGDVGDYRLSIESPWTPAIHDAFDTVMEVAVQIRMDFLDPPTVIYRNVTDEDKAEIKKVAKRWNFIMMEDDPDYNDYDEIMDELKQKGN